MMCGIRVSNIHLCNVLYKMFSMNSVCIYFIYLKVYHIILIISMEIRLKRKKINIQKFFSIYDIWLYNLMGLVRNSTDLMSSF